MFPWIYEFRWSAHHIIFLGTFFSVAAVILTAVAMATVRAYNDFRKNNHEDIRWEADFEDLPQAARACRHELTGEVRHRTCERGFDCRSCKVHPVFLASHDPVLSQANDEGAVFGFTMPPDRRYHRGHAWVKNEGNGIYAIGLDDFGTRMIGNPDFVELPAPGTLLRANGMGWLIGKKQARLRILSPMDGEVIERGGADKDWYLKIRGEESETATRHLLHHGEIRPWIMRELERLQLSLSTDGSGMSLADGGELMPDMWKQAPDVDWDGVWGGMFLNA